MRFPPLTMLLAGACVILSFAVHQLTAAPWPQFRGLNGSGREVGTEKLPAEIGPATNVVWKTELFPGHSSPAIWGERIFVTGVDGERLLTIGLDRASGKILWQAEAPHEKLEEIHRIGNYAQCSPVTDGERVVSFFGSSGLYCYDMEGKLLWNKRMGPFKNDFGAGSSPLIVGDRVILCQDHDVGSFLMAVDKRTGEILWRTDRAEFSRNYCTPVIWENGGKKQIVVAATLRAVGYDFDTGLELWTVRGLSRVVCMTPVIGDDGTLYVAGWSAGGGGGGEEGERIVLQPFDDLIGGIDANKNGSLEVEEVSDGPLKQRFTQADRDKNGSVTKAEYEGFRDLFDKSRNVILAIKPGVSGDATKSHVVWEFTRFIPFCASPLFYDGKIFMIKDGGILTTLDAKSGKSLKTGRLSATDSYYSSPVAGDGKVYFVNENGNLTVINAEGSWNVVSTSEFEEDVHATPAIVDGKIYLRTAKHLYCFGAP